VEEAEAERVGHQLFREVVEVEEEDHCWK